MAAGDIKGTNAIVIKLTSGAAVIKGQVIDAQSGVYHPSINAATGKFAVVIDDAAADVEFRGCVYGEVEVTATAVAIKSGIVVKAASTGLVVEQNVPATVSENVGTTMETFDASGSATIFVGMVN